MTLHELITSEPSLADHVTAGNDGAIAAWLNTPSVASTKEVLMDHFVGKLYQNGGFLAVIQAAATGNQVAGMALTVIEKAKALGLNQVDISLPSTQLLLGSLVTEGLLTQAQADEVTALSDTVISPAEAAGLGHVSIEQIAKALRG